LRPRQNSPGKTAWTAWYKFIKQYTRDEKRLLRQELGAWTDVSNRQCPQYYDTESDCIIQTRPTTTVHSRRLLKFASEVASLSENVPAHSIPVTLESANAAYEPANLEIPEAPQQMPAETFAEYITQLPEWEHDLITGHREVESHHHMSLSQCLLINTKFYMVHDGGHIPGTDHGSYRWV
jgi:hypothetical protein